MIILPQIKSKYVIPSPLHIHLLLESGCLLYDVFINRICNETFGTPSEGITLITLLNRYSTTLRRDFNDVLSGGSVESVQY